MYFDFLESLWCCSKYPPNHDHGHDTRPLYYSLDESRRLIRLLTLLPCEDDEGQIACQLETASLADGPEYAAMSYVWGDADVTTEILVNNIAFRRLPI